MRSSAQHRAIWANIRKAGGLRKVIKRLRRVHGPASESRLLYHTTYKANLPSIMKYGLKPKGGQGYFKLNDISGIGSKHRVTWLATRGTAKEMRRELYPLPTSVLKVRIKKNDVESPFRNRQYIGGYDAGLEFITKHAIEPKYLREVKRFRIPRKKR